MTLAGTFKSSHPPPVRRAFFIPTPHHIGIIIEPSPYSTLPHLHTCQYWFSPSTKFSEIAKKVSNDLGLRNNQCVLLMVNNDLVHGGRTVEGILRDESDPEDGGLYVAYSDCFGGETIVGSATGVRSWGVGKLLNGAGGLPAEERRWKGPLRE
jgi:hypothetical protein